MKKIIGLTVLSTLTSFSAFTSTELCNPKMDLSLINPNLARSISSVSSMSLINNFVGEYELVDKKPTEICPEQLVIQYASSYKTLKLHSKGSGFDAKGLSTTKFILDKPGERSTLSEGGFMARKRVYKYTVSANSIAYFESEKRASYFTPVNFVELRKRSEVKIQENGDIQVLRTIEKGHHEDELELSYEKCNYQKIDSDSSEYISYFGSKDL